MNRYVLLAIPALALSVAGVIHVSHADAQTTHPAPQAGDKQTGDKQTGDKQTGDKTVSLQGPQGPFADKQVMMPFYEILLDAHNQGEKADLAVMETKIKAMIPAAFNSGKPVSQAMEDHVLGVAHQALAMGVSNPKMFESYKAFLDTMLGPQ